MNDINAGYICSCCGSFVKAYRRSFNGNMAVALLLLYKFNMRGFVKVEDFLLKNGQKRCGDFSYLTHFGLLEKKLADRKDGSPRNGYYRLTPAGIDFAANRTTVASKFIMVQGKCTGFDGEPINIIQALGRKFDYNTLMGNFQPKTDAEKSKLKQLSLL